MTEERRSQHGETISTREYLEEKIADFRKHVDEKFDDMERHNLERFKQVKDAAEKANEWRAAMSDRERNFISRAEAGIAIKSVEEKVADLKESRDKASGGNVSMDRWITIVVALASIGGFVYLLVTGHR